MRIKEFALAAMVLLALAFSSVASAAELCDIPNDWSKDALDWCVERKIIQGDGGYIYPDKSVTRAELCAMLCRSLNLTDEVYINYSDVKKTDWFYTYAAKAKAAGIMTGDGGRFRPNDAVTREEAATAIARAYGYSVIEGATIDFEDSESVSEWARGYLSAMIARGIMNGRGSLICPKDAMTKKETAALLYRIYINETTPRVDKDGSVWTPAI